MKRGARTTEEHLRDMRIAAKVAFLKSRAKALESSHLVTVATAEPIHSRGDVAKLMILGVASIDQCLPREHDLSIDTATRGTAHSVINRQAIARQIFERDGRAIVDALVSSLPGGTIDAVLIALLDHRRSRLIVSAPESARRSAAIAVVEDELKEKINRRRDGRTVSGRRAKHVRKG